MNTGLKIALSFVLFIVFISCLPPPSVLASNGVSFSDTDNHWASASIKIWSQKGIISGSNGKFRPDDPITRGEMAVILNRMMLYQTLAENSFADLDNSWYTNAILGAKAAGIITGDGVNVRPHDSVTRQEAAVMLAKALAIEPCPTSNKTFSDASEVAVWAAGYINALVNRGYMNGSSGKLYPQSPITRAEVITLLNNAVSAFYTKAGEYSSDTNQAVIINTGGVRLTDMTVYGDLILAEGIGDGDIILHNVHIKGMLIARGGGERSIYITGSSTVDTIFAARRDGKVSVKVLDSAKVTTLLVGHGSKDTHLEGTVDTVRIIADGVTVTATNAVLRNGIVEGDNSTIIIAETSAVDTISVNPPAQNTNIIVQGTVSYVVVEGNKTTVTGYGKVDNVEVKANNTSVETLQTIIAVSEQATGTFADGKDIPGGTTFITPIKTNAKYNINADINTSAKKNANTNVVTGMNNNAVSDNNDSANNSGASINPVYSISYNAGEGADGTAPATATSKAGAVITLAENPFSKIGYSFIGWRYGEKIYKAGEPFTVPASTTVFTAEWNANADTPYIVQHYLQGANQSAYTLIETERKTGITDSTATALVNTYDGFTYTPDISVISGIIAADGSLVLSLYYNQIALAPFACYPDGMTSGIVFDKVTAKPVVLSISLGSGALAATGIYSVDIEGASITDYIFDGKFLTINGSAVAALNLQPGNAIIIVTFNNSERTRSDITLTIRNVITNPEELKRAVSGPEDVILIANDIALTDALYIDRSVTFEALSNINANPVTLTSASSVRHMFTAGKKDNEDIIISFNGVILDGGGISGGIESSVKNLTLNNAMVKNCSASHGGGVYVNENCSVTIHDGEINGNISVNGRNNGGGGIYGKSNSVINITGNVVISNNIAKATTGNAGGGGIFGAADTVINISGNAVISNNRGYAGGGIYVESTADSTITISDNALISGNKASGGNGGGIYGGGTIEISGNAQVSGNEAASGGGIYGAIGIYGGSVITVKGGEISGNKAISPGNGGGIHTGQNPMTISGGKISGNTAVNGGGIYGDGAITVFGGEISGNSASGNGGGIYNGNGAAIKVTGGEISGNTAGLSGGGICGKWRNTVTISGGITGSNTASLGGGIYISYGNVNISALGVINGNFAIAAGGGDNVYCDKNSKYNGPGGQEGVVLEGVSADTALSLTDILPDILNEELPPGREEPYSQSAAELFLEHEVETPITAPETEAEND